MAQESSVSMGRQGGNALGSNRKTTHLIYGLYAAAILVGITLVVAVIINYVKRDDVKGTILESHFTWQIRTFWWTVVLFCAGLLTSVVGIGFLVIIGASLWYIYRIIKGWIFLNENRPMFQ